MKRSITLGLWLITTTGAVAFALAQAPVADSPPAAVPVAAPATPPAVPATVPPAASPERFVPTDKVRADFDVSFPIDI